MELDAQALIALANGENEFSKLKEIKNYKRSLTNKQAIGYICNVKQPNFRLGHLDRHKVGASEGIMTHN
jgi:hypothetical protein